MNKKLIIMMIVVIFIIIITYIVGWTEGFYTKCGYDWLYKGWLTMRHRSERKPKRIWNNFIFIKEEDKVVIEIKWPTPKINPAKAGGFKKPWTR